MPPAILSGLKGRQDDVTLPFSRAEGPQLVLKVRWRTFSAHTVFPCTRALRALRSDVVREAGGSCTFYLALPAEYDDTLNIIMEVSPQ